MTSIFDIPIPNPRAEIFDAITAAIEAGKEVMKIYSTNFTIGSKDDKSPVTLADMKSNETIRYILSNRKYAILSEEDVDDQNRLLEDLVWIVDPLDGTMDFVNKTGEFTIMIALVDKKSPVIGVIYWPTTGIMFAAQKNSGAFKFMENNWHRIKVTDIDELKDCRAVGSRNHLSENEKKILKDLGIKSFTTVGSSLKVGLISSGEAEVYFTTTNKMKEWDSCASYCIINEAGGKMTDLKGNIMTYNNKTVYHQNGILVTNGLVHEQIIREFENL